MTKETKKPSRDAVTSSKETATSSKDTAGSSKDTTTTTVVTPRIDFQVHDKSFSISSSPAAPVKHELVPDEDLVDQIEDLLLGERQLSSEELDKSIGKNDDIIDDLKLKSPVLRLQDENLQVDLEPEAAPYVPVPEQPYVATASSYEDNVAVAAINAANLEAHAEPEAEAPTPAFGLADAVELSQEQIESELRAADEQAVDKNPVLNQLLIVDKTPDLQDDSGFLLGRDDNFAIDKDKRLVSPITPDFDREAHASGKTDAVTNPGLTTKNDLTTKNSLTTVIDDQLDPTQSLDKVSAALVVLNHEKIMQSASASYQA